MDFQQSRAIRRTFKGNTGRMRGGKLQPVMAVACRPNEGGMLAQQIVVELDPIPGRLISEVTAEIISVFVPVQAIDAIKDPEAAYAGMTEVIRDKFLSGTPLFGLENEGKISKDLRVTPRSISGVKKVNEVARLAYNCAVNALRQQVYWKATLLAHGNTAIAPALYNSTALQLLQGVLDPDDRINGIVNLELPTVQLPVNGIMYRNSPSTGTASTWRQYSEAGGGVSGSLVSGASTDVGIRSKNADGTSPVTDWSTAVPNINAVFSGVEAGGLSLDQFYNAQTQDRLTRVMDQMLRDNPQYGEEMVIRWAHGVSVDAGKIPFVIARRREVINKSMAGAMDTDGINNDVMRTDGMLKIAYSVPVPRTELGGIVVTMVALKPDEKLAAQPDPILSDVWTADNFVADELAIDPVPVTVRELWADCDSSDETDVVMYTGLNALKRAYTDYGFSRSLDASDVENKTAIWQIDLPLSVNPDNVSYPDYIDHGIFAFPGTEMEPEDVATWSVTSVHTTPTNIKFGPTPIENVEVITDEDLFEEAP